MGSAVRLEAASGSTHLPPQRRQQERRKSNRLIFGGSWLRGTWMRQWHYDARFGTVLCTALGNRRLRFSSYSCEARGGRFASCRDKYDAIIVSEVLYYLPVTVLKKTLRIAFEALRTGGLMVFHSALFVAEIVDEYSIDPAQRIQTWPISWCRFNGGACQVGS